MGVGDQIAVRAHEEAGADRAGFEATQEFLFVARERLPSGKIAHQGRAAGGGIHGQFHPHHRGANGRLEVRGSGRADPQGREQDD